MLALLLKVPETADDWNIFSFNAADEIRRCNQAISQRDNINIPEYSIDPIPWNAVTDWLQNLSQSIGIICELLNITARDIFNVDLRDQNARIGWVYDVFSQLRDAEAALQI